MQLIHEVIKVPGFPTSRATLTGYVTDNCTSIGEDRLHPAILNLPGGGYEHVSFREGEPVCLRYAAEGIHAFNLEYSVFPQAAYPQALCEVLLAMAYIRTHAAEYHIDPDNIAIGGFSAGGHLALTAAAFGQDPDVQNRIQNPGSLIKPNKLVLSYPVVSSGIYAHRGSFSHLLAKQAEDPAILQKFSMETQITEDFPPVFLWHTDTDMTVPVENSLLLAMALKEKQIPMELHIYPEGPHGLSLGNYVSNHGVAFDKPFSCHTWIQQAVSFLYE
ncbi:MAG: alpha/beta hydrolase [Lachnospiraceae bacterium]|jgi:acetyl esterase/lipase